MVVVLHSGLGLWGTKGVLVRRVTFFLLSQSFALFNAQQDSVRQSRIV